MIVITGSESFIGKALTSHLDQAGIAWVGVDSVPRDSRCVHADIRDRKLAERIPYAADAIVHLAAISRDKDCRADPELAFDVNVGGTLNVLRTAAATHAGQVIFASSEWVYGEVGNDEIQCEDAAIDATRLTSEYALTKLCGERLMAAAVQRGQIPAATVLRFGIVYGPRESNWSAVEALFDAVRSKNTVEVNGSLATARRFIHVDDVARGVLASVGRPGFEIFNLSGDCLVSLGEVIRESARITRRDPAIVERDPAAVSIRNPENAKARKQLNWTPQFDLRSGLASLEGAHV